MINRSLLKPLALVLVALAAFAFTGSAAHADATAPTTEFVPASDTSLADIEAAMAETAAGAAILAGTTPVHHAEANHRQLPTTGFPSGEVAAVAAGLILVGGLMVRRSRRESAAA